MQIDRWMRESLTRVVVGDFYLFGARTIFTPQKRRSRKEWPSATQGASSFRVGSVPEVIFQLLSLGHVYTESRDSKGRMALPKKKIQNAGMSFILIKWPDVFFFFNLHGLDFWEPIGFVGWIRAGHHQSVSSRRACRHHDPECQVFVPHVYSCRSTYRYIDLEAKLG